MHATVAEDYWTSAIAVSLGLIGFFLARRAFRAGRQLVTSPATWRVLEHKLYFDEAYDALFYRPAAALSVALRRNVEEPVVERSLDEIGSGTIQVGGEVARVQSGLLRTYAVAIAFSVVVLVVVFVAVRWRVLTTALILLPIAGALVVAILPLPRQTTAGSRSWWRSWKWALDRRGCTIRLRRRRLAARNVARVGRERRDLLLGRLLRLLALARGATVVVFAAATTRSGSGGSAHARTTR